jgi:hypothetical protein
MLSKLNDLKIIGNLSKMVNKLGLEGSCELGWTK